MIKGNVIVGQSGGPTAVINSSLAGVYSAAKKLGADKVYGMRNGIAGFLNGEHVDLDTYLAEDKNIELLKRTPGAFLGSCRYKLPAVGENDSVYEKLFEKFGEMGISCVAYIGGNDSMDTVQKLSAYAKKIGSDIRVVGVPKTVDNDLYGTDHTPGFGSAAKFVATEMKEVIRDCNAYDMKSVTIVEIMGRNAGWLTAAAILTKGSDCEGPDLIYLPEVAFDTEAFLDKIRALLKVKNTIVIAVSEGVRDSRGKYVCEEAASGSKDAFGHQILSGVGEYLANMVNLKLGVKARGIVLNTPQRCGAHITSLCDVNEAFAAGEAAVKCAESGDTGKVMAFKRISDRPYAMEIVPFDVNEVANVEHTVPLEWIVNDGSYISDEMIKYCRPLIMGELEPFMVDGLPQHLVL